MYSNKRFPHSCKVFRSSAGGDAFEKDTFEELYSGECRNYITTKSIGDSKVKSSQYTLAIPAYRKSENGTMERIYVKSFAGDKVECLDERGKVLEGTVVDCYMGNLGTNVYWNYDAN